MNTQTVRDRSQQQTPAGSEVVSAKAPVQGRPRSLPALRVTVLKFGLKARTTGAAKKDWTTVYTSGKVLAKLLPLAGGCKKLVADAVREAAQQKTLHGFNRSVAVLTRAERILAQTQASRAAAAAANNAAWVESPGGVAIGGMQ